MPTRTPSNCAVCGTGLYDRPRYGGSFDYVGRKLTVRAADLPDVAATDREFVAALCPTCTDRYDLDDPGEALLADLDTERLLDAGRRAGGG